MPTKPSDNTYYIDFDLKEMPGRVLATRIKIDQSVMREDDDVPTGLHQHPLYHKLATYVAMNPPKIRKD